MPVLVLGARLRKGAVGPMLEARLRAALARYEAAAPGSKPIVVVSGKGEAPAMARWLAERGVASEHLVAEERAESTNENLENAHALIPHAGRWVVVTNGFHVWRTRLWVWHLRLPMRVVAAPTVGRRRPVTYAREVAAVVHSSARIAWRRAVRRWARR
ncbi:MULTISPECIES: YdcF family protein [unclassified Corynebacterium]|uniref:YdcF family protein n=1 Tax=unclassified Corynebacterium TaxID=2624378 RepID=UPI0029CA9E4A|nr:MULTISPECIES: YdcF family protein [unclassified Corynebacterium]WPF66626.1 YdcF family protein [Corynebacterium sp. 22KM0430]WPF69114.1 YdcF family protein [Corynebacterium sp. 21KM1197]